MAKKKLKPKARPVPQPPPAPPRPPATGDPVPNSEVQFLLDLHNQERARVGVPPLLFNNALGIAAWGHALDMAATGNYSHQGTGGTDPGDRIARRGYAWSGVAENIHYGPKDARSAFDPPNGWMSSPGHAAHVRDPFYIHAGFAKAVDPRGVFYWVVVFGRPMGRIDFDFRQAHGDFGRTSYPGPMPKVIEEA